MPGPKVHEAHCSARQWPPPPRPRLRAARCQRRCHGRRLFAGARGRAAATDGAGGCWGGGRRLRGDRPEVRGQLRSPRAPRTRVAAQRVPRSKVRFNFEAGLDALSLPPPPPGPRRPRRTRQRPERGRPAPGARPPGSPRGPPDLGRLNRNCSPIDSTGPGERPGACARARAEGRRAGSRSLAARVAAPRRGRSLPYLCVCRRLPSSPEDFRERLGAAFPACEAREGLDV